MFLLLLESFHPSAGTTEARTTWAPQAAPWRGRPSERGEQHGGQPEQNGVWTWLVGTAFEIWEKNCKL